MNTLIEEEFKYSYVCVGDTAYICKNRICKPVENNVFPVELIKSRIKELENTGAEVLGELRIKARQKEDKPSYFITPYLIKGIIKDRFKFEGMYHIHFDGYMITVFNREVTIAGNSREAALERIVESEYDEIHLNV